jgi:hypothetical protein
MASVFAAPQSFTVNASSEQTTAPASNAGTPHPGLVWRSNGLTSVYVTVQNLRATDTVRVRGASSAAMTSPVFDVTAPAWSGVAPARGAMTVIQLANTYAPAFVRIDITSTGNPAGYVEVQRLVISKKVSCDGVDIGCEQAFEDQSAVEDTMGYTTVDEVRVRDAWKATVSNIKEADWYNTWYPFVRSMGKTRDFLFVPDTDPTFMQNQVIMGRMTSRA